VEYEDPRLLTRDEARRITTGEAIERADTVLKVSVAPTGVLIAGKSTDLVILDQDPTKVDPSTIRPSPRDLARQ
jgi:predicted amidohydrolase YtcJ